MTTGERDRCALLVLDIQNDFFGKNARMPIDSGHAQEIMPKINMMIQHAQTAGWEVIYVGNEFRRSDPGNLFRNFAALAGSLGAKLCPELQVSSKNYFPKRTGNAFKNQDLVEYVKGHKVSGVMITGVFAEGCVFQTTKGAIKVGVHPIVIEDAIGAKTEHRRKRMIPKYKRIGAEVETSNVAMDI